MPTKSRKSSSTEKSKSLKSKPSKSSTEKSKSLKSKPSKSGTKKIGGGENKVNNSKINETPKPKDEVYIIPSNNKSDSSYSNVIYTVNKVNGDNYTISRPGRYWGRSDVKKLKKSEISPPIGYEYKNNKIKIGEKYLVEPSFDLPDGKRIAVRAIATPLTRKGKYYKTFGKYVLANGKSLKHGDYYTSNNLLEVDKRLKETGKAWLRTKYYGNNNEYNNSYFENNSKNSKKYNNNNNNTNNTKNNKNTKNTKKNPIMM